MKFLTKNDILGASDIRKEVVEVPEWGEGAAVYVRVMDAKGRDAFERYARKMADSSDSFRAFVCSLVISDEDGKLLFTEQDVNALADKSWHALNRVFDKAIAINAVTKDGHDELKKTS